MVGAGPADSQKRERLLGAAGRVFARDGLDAPMPTVAAEAGAGVASLYRQFPSKHELLAALVVRRLEQFTDATEEAAAREGDRWSVLTGLRSSSRPSRATRRTTSSARRVRLSRTIPTSRLLPPSAPAARSSG